MKIAILTLPPNENIGGILQSFALRQVFLKQGHEVVHIEEKKKGSVAHWSSARFYTWWFTRRLLAQIVTLNLDKMRNKAYQEAYYFWEEAAPVRTFVQKYLPRRVVDKFEMMKDDHFDYIVVGSDQIWRPLYYSKIEDAFLAFAEQWKAKRVAYAPSFGVQHWEFSTEQTQRCAALLQKFDAVSVREDHGVEMCSKKFGLDVVRLLDPTMLLDRIDYQKLIGKEIKIKNNQLTTYVLDMNPGKRNIISQLESAKNMSCVELGLTKASIEQWLQEFMQAEFIFTDSFHGCVFAILLHKPFIVYGNKERGLSRFETLLHLFQLEDRIVFDTDAVLYLYDKQIDWDKIGKILATERQKSRQFFEDIGL
jgi:hypothetical protein